MKKIKLFCVKFILYVYIEYIKEDWSIYTPIGKLFIYPSWVILSILIWIISPLFLPEFLFKQSNLYKKFLELQSSPEFTSHFNSMPKL